MTDRRPGLSVRLKLTLSYAAFLVIVGAAIFALGFLLLRFVPEGNLATSENGFAPGRADLLEVFVRYAWATMVGLAFVGLVGGWIVAGIMLRPLDRITAAALRAGEGSFDHRISLPGRRDELRDLADTFDEMLDRVRESIEQQSRFAANASHELRTPHAIMRTMLDVARSDPSRIDLDLLLTRLEETNERAIRLTEAILALSRISRDAPLTGVPLRLDHLIGEVIAELGPEAVSHGVSVTSDVDAPAGTSFPGVTVVGDETLLRQLIGNVVRNAVIHNLVRDGWVRISATATAHGTGAVVDVTNSGSELDPEIVHTLAEPFVRGSGRVRGRADGVGLGLAISTSVARAHGGSLELLARHGGGMSARIRLP